MEVQMLGVMIPIILIISIAIMVVYLRKFENTERMAMIEKGVSPELFQKKNVANPSVTLRFALLMIGCGVGLLMGYFLDRSFDMEEVAYFSMLFIFGGLGLGAAYMLEDRKFRAQP